MNSMTGALVSRQDIWNAVVSIFDQPIPLDGGAQMTLSRMAAPDKDDCPGFSVRAGEANLFVAIEDFPFNAATGVDLPFARIGTLPETLRHALMDGMQNALLAALPEQTRAQVEDIRRAPMPKATTGRWLRVAIDAGWGQPALLRVLTSESRLSELAVHFAIGAGEPAPVNTVLASVIPMHCLVSLPGRVVPLASLRALETGDLILLENAFDRRDLLAQTYRVSMALEEDSWIIKETGMSDTDEQPLRLDPTMAAVDPMTAAESAPALSSIEDLPIRLRFVLEDREVTLAELQQLVPGSVFPMPVAEVGLGQSVRILANGRTIGTGNLVDVDGQKAVRVSDILGRSDKT